MTEFILQAIRSVLACCCVLSLSLSTFSLHPTLRFNFNVDLFFDPFCCVGLFCGINFASRWTKSAATLNSGGRGTGGSGHKSVHIAGSTNRRSGQRPTMFEHMFPPFNFTCRIISVASLIWLCFWLCCCLTLGRGAWRLIGPVWCQMPFDCNIFAFPRCSYSQRQNHYFVMQTIWRMSKTVLGCPEKLLDDSYFLIGALSLSLYLSLPVFSCSLGLSRTVHTCGKRQPATSSGQH